MARTHPIDELVDVAPSFGAAPAARKQRLLAEIAARPHGSVRRLLRLHDALSFICAYPDNPVVLASARALNDTLRDRVERYTGGDTRLASLVNTGLPGTCNAYPYAYGVLQRLSERFPGSVDIDWSEVAEIPPITDALNLAVAPAESRGLEDEYQELPDWLRQNALRSTETDLEVVLRLLRRSPLSEREQAHVFETLQLPVLFHLRDPGSAACEAMASLERVTYQRRPIPTGRFPLRPRIRRPLGHRRHLASAEGREWLDRALVTLCRWNLEIHPLVYANPEDVTIVDGPRGLQVLLAGMVPAFRQALESDFFFFISKNGVPIAYGPASVFDGCCEMGINLFPVFRGGEIRLIYAQLMNALYHLVGVRYFFVTSYGMGENNPEALKTGAFWFYRKLGFRAVESDVERLAREEEAVMRRHPGYRSSMRTLRALSHTAVYLDLSGGRLKPLDFESLGRVVTEWIKLRYGGDRRRAIRGCVRQVAPALGMRRVPSWSRDERLAFERLAPVLATVADLARWPARDKQRLLGAIRARGGASEFEYIRSLRAIPRATNALHLLANRG